MNLLLFGAGLAWLVVGLFVCLGSWIGFQLIHQNGRLLTRLEKLEGRLSELGSQPVGGPALLQLAARRSAVAASPNGIAAVETSGNGHAPLGGKRSVPANGKGKAAARDKVPAGRRR